jgi:hypothetical protein
MRKGNVPDLDLHNDPRWEMFNMYTSDTTFQAHLGVALGNFSGNIVWPIKEFKRVGGYWNYLYTGRCEDGELGVRAAVMGVPMTLVRDARAFHQGAMMAGHGDPEATKKNQRDVPLINERHPYIQEQGLVVADRDGKRFDYKCECGQQINSLEIWEHGKRCDALSI